MREEIIGDARLILADCRDILPNLGRFGAVVTDPPYGIGEAAGKNKSRGNLAVAKDCGNQDWDNEAYGGSENSVHVEWDAPRQRGVSWRSSYTKANWCHGMVPKMASCDRTDGFRPFHGFRDHGGCLPLTGA